MHSVLLAILFAKIMRKQFVGSAYIFLIIFANNTASRIHIMHSVLDLACHVVCKDYEEDSVFVTHTALKRTHSTLTNMLRKGKNKQNTSELQKPFVELAEWSFKQLLQQKTVQSSTITQIAIADYWSCPVPLKKTLAASLRKSWCKSSSRRVVCEKVKKSWLINYHLPSASISQYKFIWNSLYRICRPFKSITTPL